METLLRSLGKMRNQVLLFKFDNRKKNIILIITIIGIRVSTNTDIAESDIPLFLSKVVMKNCWSYNFLDIKTAFLECLLI